jgi:hypothetical protein
MHGEVRTTYVEPIDLDRVVLTRGAHGRRQGRHRACLHGNGQAGAQMRDARLVKGAKWVAPPSPFHGRFNSVAPATVSTRKREGGGDIDNAFSSEGLTYRVKTIIQHFLEIHATFYM